MTNLTAEKRNFLVMYVYDCFKLDMCTYGELKTNDMKFTDMFWKEGCKVPKILVSEVVDLINKGIMKANN